MVKVKDLETIKARYRAGAGVAPAKYREAVEKTVGVIEAAKAAEDLWAAAIRAAADARRREKGLARVTDADWRKGAVEKGSVRIGAGMVAAVDKQATRFAPYKSALEAVTLPARGIDPMANIDARLKPVVGALVEKKKEIKG